MGTGLSNGLCAPVINVRKKVSMKKNDTKTVAGPIGSDRPRPWGADHFGLWRRGGSATCAKTARRAAATRPCCNSDARCNGYAGCDRCPCVDSDAGPHAYGVSRPHGGCRDSSDEAGRRSLRDIDRGIALSGGAHFRQFPCALSSRNIPGGLGYVREPRLSGG